MTGKGAKTMTTLVHDTRSPSKIPCIDLKATFGDRFRYGWDPAYASGGEGRFLESAWLQTIRCYRGKVFPWGHDRLAAYVDGRVLKGKLMRIPACLTETEGDTEVIVSFEVDALELVLKVLRPYKRRKLSPEVRRIRTEGLAAWRAAKTQSPRDSGAVESTIGSPPRGQPTPDPIVPKRGS